MRPHSALAAVTSVRVGTLNEPKIEAVREAFTAYAPEAVVGGTAVESGVPDQPVGWEEIVLGARNRARRAFASGPCDLAVGIEDGLVELALGGGVAGEEGEREVLNVGCAAVVDGRRESLGFSSGFAYPPACVEPALANREPIGDVFDRVFDGASGASVSESIPSGRSIGNIGKLSLGVLPRSDYARHAVVCALVRFLHPALYDMKSG